MAAAGGFRCAPFSSDAAAAAAAAPTQGPGSDNKRPKSLLKAAITRLDGPSKAAAVEAAQAPETATQVGLDAQRQQQQDQRVQALQQLQDRLQQQRSAGEAAASSWQQPSAAPLSDAAAGAGADDDDVLLHLNSDDSAVGGDDAHVESVEAAGAAKQQQQQRHMHMQAQQAPVVVPACGPECTHTHSNGWCHAQVGAVGAHRSQLFFC